MRESIDGFPPPAHGQAEQLLHAITTAEQIIVSAIERECEALRAGRMLAARALHAHLRDAARIYLSAARAARTSIRTLEHVMPGVCDRLEERRAAFASLLKVELAVLAAERAAAFDDRADLVPAEEPAPRAIPSASGSRQVPRVIAITDAPRRPNRRRAG